MARSSCLPRWKFTDSCGRPQPPRGARHLGCGHAHHAPDASCSGERQRRPELAIVGAGGASAVFAPADAAAAKTRVFPAPPPLVSPIAGLIDTHIHAAPDVFGRAIDDDAAAALARERGLEAIVFKNHVVATADRAFLARKHVGGINVFGGIVLNAAVGGINPDAVAWMWRMQGGYGRVVWFPTFDADNHVKHFKDAPEGIKVLDGSGAVLPEVRAVLKICAEQKLVVQTGHLAPAEALAVIRAGRDLGVDRLIVTHAQFEVVDMSLAEMKEAAGLGAKLELCAVGPLMGRAAHLAWMHAWRQVKIEETVAAVREVGARHFVLGTDLGQSGNPTPADGLQVFVFELMKAGISADEIRLMGRETTGALLMG
jgi:hypothetical protein